MIAKHVALVARADRVRTQISKYLVAGGYDVFECEELAIPGRFVRVVLVDEPDGPVELVRARVQAWIKLARPPRVVVISSKPALWKPLALAHSDELFVLAAPAFGWEIVDALRATSPEAPRGA
jgi:hypothetical protein